MLSVDAVHKMISELLIMSASGECILNKKCILIFVLFLQQHYFHFNNYYYSLKVHMVICTLLNAVHKLHYTSYYFYIQLYIDSPPPDDVSCDADDI